MQIIKQKIKNKPLTIVGDGKQSRDFVYVTDVARAFLAAAKTSYVGKIYNVGTGKSQSINYLVKLLKGKKFYIPKRPGEPMYLKANISKIKKELNWSPKISFETGIKELIKNINYWKSAPLWNKAKIKKTTKKWFESLNKK